MTFAVTVLFERILHRDRLVHQILIVHGFYRSVRVIKVVVGNKAVALGLSGLRVPSDLYQG